MGPSATRPRSRGGGGGRRGSAPAPQRIRPLGGFVHLGPAGQGTRESGTRATRDRAKGTRERAVWSTVNPGVEPRAA